MTQKLYPEVYSQREKDMCGNRKTGFHLNYPYQVAIHLNEDKR